MIWKQRIIYAETGNKTCAMEIGQSPRNLACRFHDCLDAADEAGI